MSNSVISTFEKADTPVSVTLHSSGFTKDGEHYIKVSRSTVTLSNMLAEIIEENRGLDPYMIQHAATLLQQQILKSLSHGKSVNILDLGVLYITMKGCVKGENPNSSDLPNFIVKFTPYSLVNEAVSNLVVDKIVLSNNTPLINLITDEWTREENKTLTKNRTCCIEGKKLKLGGIEYPIAFVKVDENGDEIEGEDTIMVSSDKIITNSPGKLRFYIPDELATDSSYKIRLSTCWINKKTSRKVPVTTESEPLTVQ